MLPEMDWNACAYARHLPIRTIRAVSVLWDWLTPSGLSTMTLLRAVLLRDQRGHLPYGQEVRCVSFLQILAPELNDWMLSTFWIWGEKPDADAIFSRPGSCHQASVKRKIYRSGQDRRSRAEKRFGPWIRWRDHSSDLATLRQLKSKEKSSSVRSCKAATSECSRDFPLVNTATPSSS